MTFETGTANDPQDLLSKLESFLTSVSPTAFSIDRSVASSSPVDFAFNDGDGGFWQCVIESVDPDAFRVHQSIGFDGSGVPNEPGQGTNLIGYGHQVNLIPGPYSAYFFYMNADASVGPVYCHCVLEFESGKYRHFGFGNIEKFGTWTGGEYSHGHFLAGDRDNPGSNTHRWPFDGVGGDARDTGRMRLLIDTASGWNGAVDSPAQKWWCAKQTAAGTDGDGVDILSGGWQFRAGWWAHTFIEIGGSSQFNGFKPLAPIGAWLHDIAAAPDERYFLGFAPDVRMINLDGVIPGASIVQGGDTWDAYPIGRKYFIVDATEGTGNWGLAYKRII